MIQVSKLLLVNKIPYDEFNYKNADYKYGLANYLQDDDDGYNPGYLWPKDNEESIKFSSEANEALPIIPKNLILDYPFSKTVIIPLSNCTTVKDLMIDCLNAYKACYAIEDKTTTIEPTLLGEIGKEPMYNRVETDGIIGIWGHCIDDLVLHDIYIYEDGTVGVCVSS